MTDNLKARIKNMIHDEHDKRIKVLCSDESPFGVVLRVALEKHTTPQCKMRCFIEGMYSWYKISKDEFYLDLSKCLIEYANLIFNNRIEQNFFRELILEKWLDYSAEEFPYLIMDCKDRMKSLISEINDLVDKTLKSQIADELLVKVPKLFEEGEQNEAKEILDELEHNYASSRNKDIYGVMFIVEYYDRVRDLDNPEYLRTAAIRLGENCIRFMRQNAITVLSLKDFIREPKDNGYSSYQFVIRGTNNPLELQIRSMSMHRNNENPASPASHLTYKNTPFNNYLNNIVDEIYGVCPESSDIFEKELKRKENHRNRFGVTDGIPLFSFSRLCRTPNGEIPTSLECLDKFEEVELLAELYASHKSKD